MLKRGVLLMSALVTICLFLIIPGGDILAQWPQPPQQPYPQQPQYPPSQPQYPPSQQQYPPPGQQQYPPQPQIPIQSPVQPSGQTFNDALGRFKVNLPQGTMPWVLLIISAFLLPCARSALRRWLKIRCSRCKCRIFQIC